MMVWFRRDLRLDDHGALAVAGDEFIVPVFVLDPVLLRSTGPVRLAHLSGSLRALDERIQERGGGGLVIRTGNPRTVLPQLADAHGCDQVLVSGDYSPFGVARDAAVAAALAQVGVTMRSVDTPFLHPPGTVMKPDGSAFAVFTPYWRVWQGLPVEAPLDSSPRFISSLPDRCDPLPTGRLDVAGSGERRAQELLATFVQRAEGYDADRNRPDLSATSRLGAALHFGEIHPRTVVAATGAATGFVRQLCWREFYADVLFRRPDAAWGNIDRRFDVFGWRDDADHFEAWCQGRTGYPMVDAGMRQLLATGWLHNRSRMVVASFLTKDLLLPWQWGARWFLTHLRDGDVANNSLGWQWVAGTGMDAAPYYRVFNPVLQGQKFDPTGDYVREYVPELTHLPGAAVHTPWESPDGYAHGYPLRVVDHAQARQDALAAYTTIKNA
jgi:deoxyribodipyrimidine photo-lyase